MCSTKLKPVSPCIGGRRRFFLCAGAWCCGSANGFCIDIISPNPIPLPWTIGLFLCRAWTASFTLRAPPRSDSAPPLICSTKDGRTGPIGFSYPIFAFGFGKLFPALKFFDRFQLRLPFHSAIIRTRRVVESFFVSLKGVRQVSSFGCASHRAYFSAA